MKLEVKRYIPEKVDLYYNNEYYDTLNNEHELNLFKIEMLKNKCTHLYHIVWKDIKITFDEKANMSKFPSGMYDTLNVHLGEIFRLTKDTL